MNAAPKRPLLSRVADAVYWMARYIERAENVARFIDVNHNLMLDLPRGSSDQWQPIVDITGDRAIFQERGGAATQENVVRFLAFEPEYPNSIYSCIVAARENARSVRETISSEMWSRSTACTCWSPPNPQRPARGAARILPPDPHGLPPVPWHRPGHDEPQ